MTLFWYYFIMAMTAGVLLALYFIFRKKINQKWTIVFKTLSLVLVLVFFVRYIGGEDAIEDVLKFSNSPVAGKFLTIMGLLCTWFMYANVVLLALYPFFKCKSLTNSVKYFSTFVTLLNVAFLFVTIPSIDGAGALTSITLRGVLMSIETALSLLYCVSVWVDNPSFKLTGREVWVLFIGSFAMLLAAMPSHIPKAFLGYLNPAIEIDDFSQWHRIFLYFSFIIPLIIYFALRKKSENIIRFSMLFLSLAAMFIFMSNYKALTWLNPTQWPIHLCHTAMYIIPLCLIFKWNRLFYFSYFINVLGAFLAMAMPNLSGNITSWVTMHFWYNHFMAFFMPLLLVALKVFRRPKLKEFWYAITAFTVYFVAIMFINAYFTNFGTVDFFFINSDFVAEKLGKWAENLRNFTWTFSIGGYTMVLYPLYQFLYYLVYVAAAAGMWFIYEQAYNFTDTLNDMQDRRRKFKLDELALQIKLEGRSEDEPMNLENKDKMILRKFTKRYGNSNVYAVKDANLEVNGGEIFGFLGPNGAGKSTIIKSIVGIQPITSGEIEVCGYDVGTQGVQAKKQIGFVPDHYALYEKLTGREYINYIADLYGVSKRDRTTRINKYLKNFELQNAFDNQMKTYSHGMKQKVAIMAALVHNPKIWILDEPLTGLDPNSIYQVKESMKNHAKEGNIVFFSSHIIDVVERICDRIGIIKKGQIQLVEKVQDILNRGETLEHFYLNTIENSHVEEIKVEQEVLEQDKLSNKANRKKQREKVKKERLAKRKERLAKRKAKLEKRQKEKLAKKNKIKK